MTATRQISQLFTQARDVTLLVHQRPDGDAIGSSVALLKALTQAGKVARIVCIQGFPDVFLQITGPVTVDRSLPNQTDLIVLLDCGDLHRTGFGRQLRTLGSRCPVVVIDHHDIGDASKITAHYHYEKTAATAEIVFGYLTTMRQIITPEMANALLMGIYTDTGSFRHANTSSQTLQVASRLIRYGANLAFIAQTFSQNIGIGKKRLWGKALSEMRLSRWGVVSTIIKKTDLVEAEATYEDVAGLANMLALTDEAKAAMVLVENGKEWRGVLRTRHQGIDLSQLAALFGGRGQKKAAGFTATKEIFSGKIGK